MSTWDRFHALGSSVAIAGALLMLASMPVSRALFNVAALLLVLGWLASGRYRETWQAVRLSSVALLAIVLFGWVALSGLVGDGPAQVRWSNVLVYSKLLYIPLLLVVLSDASRRRHAWRAYEFGMLLLLMVLFLDIWLDIPGTRTYGQTPNIMDKGVFYHHIAQGAALACFALYAAHRALNHPKGLSRWFWAVVSLLTAVAVFFVNESRTGQVALLAGAAAMMLTLLDTPRKALIAFATTAALVVAVVASGAITERFKQGFQEIQNFAGAAQHSSMGARVHMWVASRDFITQSPWLGHGAGSYPALAAERFGADPALCRLACAQPHNQFLQTGVEQGLTGVALLAALLLSMAATGATTRSPDARLLLPLFAVLGTTALFDSALLIRPQAFLFLSLTGLLLAEHAAANRDVKRA